MILVGIWGFNILNLLYLFEDLPMFAYWFWMSFPLCNTCLGIVRFSNFIINCFMGVSCPVRVFKWWPRVVCNFFFLCLRGVWESFLSSPTCQRLIKILRSNRTMVLVYFYSVLFFVCLVIENTYTKDFRNCFILI